jgi:uncharacterized RDD family membrane protein YckC
MPGESPSLILRTPEGVAFALPLAGPVSRLLARAVDLACVTAFLNLLRIGFMALGILSLDIAQALWILATFATTIGYAIATEWLWRGQTLGQRLLRLRVLDAEGLRLQPSQIVLRNLLRAVDVLPAFYLVGGLTMLLSRRAQRLGDLAANTIVVRAPRPSEPDLEQLLAGPYNSLRELPHLAARLRQKVSPQAGAVALQALVRREELTPADRVALFAEIASGFRELVPYPAEVADPIADEQYVRNVVDVVYRTKAGATAAAKFSR